MELKLFINETTGEVMHYLRAKEWISEKINAELPIADNEIALLLLEDKELSVIDDEISKWCARYAGFMEADRYLTDEEKAMSIYNIYMAIVGKDEKSLMPVVDALKENDDPAGTRLLITLNGLLEEKEEVER